MDEHGKEIITSMKVKIYRPNQKDATIVENEDVLTLIVSDGHLLVKPLNSMDNRILAVFAPGTFTSAEIVIDKN